ncbi:MAG: ABC transporter substrate-binding protein [Nakamurella sp.]
MRVRPVHSVLALVTGALVVLAGCTAGSSTNPTSTAGGSATGSAGGSPISGSNAAPSDATLSVGFVLAPKTLDMSVDDGAAIPQALLYNVYEGLVRLDDSGKIVPLLAEKYEVSSDNKTYTFTLRKDVKFSDGAPFTAADAVFSIERVKKDWKPAVKAGMDVVSKAEAVDDSTLKVTLSKPSQSWLYAMATRIGAMYSRTGVSALAAKPIGTGPFTVQSYQTNVQLILQRNDAYWGDAPALKTVNLKYYADANALNNALLGGQINVISTVQAPETLSQFADAGKYQTIEGTTTGEVLLSFNNGKAPLSDKTVRQAITYAIDRKAIMDTVWAGKGQLIGTHSVPTDPWYEDLYSKYPYDPAKAKELLGGKTYTLRLRVPNVPYATATAPIIASQLKQVGITVTVDTLDFPSWLEQVFKNADYDMSIVAHVEPRDIANIWGNAKYYTRYDNPEVQKLFTDGDAGTEEEFNADYKKAAELLADDAAGDWLWVLPNLIVANTNVKGILQNQVSESFDFTKISVG